jgi:glycosyltransferase involved in cell wall biosynthesis
MRDGDRPAAGPPAVTAMMTVHNGMPFVQDAVDSLLGQDFDDFELVVVDDGSTDGTAEALGRRTDPRLRLVRRPQEGRVAALNHAVGQARGRYLANLDADDLALPGRLALPARFLDEHPEVAVVGSGIQPFIGEQAGRRPRRLPCSDRAIRWSFLLRNPVFNSSATFRASSLAGVGGYDPAYSDVLDDADLLLRLGRHHRLYNLNVPLAAKRLHGRQHFAAVDRRRRLFRHAACRLRAARELRFPLPLRPVAYAVAAAGAARSVIVIGLAGRNGGLRRAALEPSGGANADGQGLKASV